MSAIGWREMLIGFGILFALGCFLTMAPSFLKQYRRCKYQRGYASEPTSEQWRNDWRLKQREFERFMKNARQS